LQCGRNQYPPSQENYESELRALDIRVRASRRADELIAEGQKNGNRLLEFARAAANEPVKDLSSQPL